MASGDSLTLQDLIDEENRTVLESLDPNRKGSPSSKRTAAPHSPSKSYARDTLNVDSSTPRHGSIAGIGVGVTNINEPRKKRLNPADPSTWTSPHSTSPNDLRPRAVSESQSTAVPMIHLESAAPEESSNVITDTLTTQPEALGAVRQSLESPNNELGGSIESGHVVPGQKLPHIPLAMTSSTATESKASPHQAPSSPTNLAAPTISNDGDRRFSNQSASFSTTTDDSERIGTIHKDNMKDDDEEALQDSSDEEQYSSDQDEGSPVSERGRTREGNREPPAPDSHTNTNTKELVASPEIRVHDTSAPKQDQPHPPDHSGKLSETRGGVHPQSNYQRAASPAALSAVGDDDAELKRAKALQLRVSQMDETIKDRSVKMIIRGEWSRFQDHEDEEQTYRHEPRLYLVCSDLSNEATYALEWTVGTLLKDGDTLLIIGAMEDENAPKQKEHEEPSLEIRLESAKAAEEANSTMVTLTRQTTNQKSDANYEADKKSRLAAVKDPARSSSRGGRSSSRRGGHERFKAVEKLETDFLRFVRKTTLQVRCMIEVIHCRSPRHLILNAIDELEPTLVIVGTRGQSTLKGVMMGSFSNYLVQKSSVPVMVARKRLKKPHHAKVNSAQIRMTNNLKPLGLSTSRKSLTQARID